ncbi:hypothetical protein DCM91_05490 [Chitinophaga costaii]|nr:hypothetical protein DCM91_05490 [Chitinophaga costaii]
MAHEGPVIYEKATGMANLEQQVPMPTRMVCRLGSMTKQNASHYQGAFGTYPLEFAPGST